MGEPHAEQADPSPATWRTLDPRQVPYLRRVGGLRVGVEAVVLMALAAIAFPDRLLTPT